MNEKTVAIIGGSQERSFQQLGEKMGCNVLFHNGKTRKGKTKREFQSIVQNSDCVVILLGACSHDTMNAVKDLCKKMKVNLEFQQGRGGSQAIQKGLGSLQKAS